MTVPADHQAGPASGVGVSPDAMLGGVQVPLSALEHYEYCPRQAGLILVEEGYADDAATVRGTLLHQRVHEPGADSRPDVRTLRALPVWHDGLGMTGVCDIVEMHREGRIVPVEHKSGRYVRGGPADVQVAAQAMCLEEMFDTPVPTGVIFSAADRRRHDVSVSSALRARVAAAVREVRAVLSRTELPAPVADRRCRNCSMHHLCLPRLLAGRRTYTLAEMAVFTPAREPDGGWDD